MSKGFQKGNDYSKGRPKGAKNRKTEEWDSIGEYFANQGAIRYLDALKASNDKEFMDRYEKTLEYFKPKLARSEITGKDGKDLIPQPIMDVRKNNGNS